MSHACIRNPISRDSSVVSEAERHWGIPQKRLTGDYKERGSYRIWMSRGVCAAAPRAPSFIYLIK